ncbi:MAG: hypothetical protein H0X11_13980 [Betaproteobacteria bacterium]|nr:hypothetical protein [Betaproteobacteria bacterium]
MVVVGPFMPPARQRHFRDRAERIGRIDVVTFDTHIELLMERSVGVVAMGGYNTFCEILSLDKRAILIPRVAPRREQLMRANRAAALELVRTLDPEGPQDAALMARALRDLREQPAPSERGAGQMLDGLQVITGLVSAHVGGTQRVRARAGAL